jgi:hypothetical protein
MSFNGSGSFSTLATLASSATITAAEHNNEWANIKGGLELAVLRDGQNSPSANLPMATKRHTGVGNSAARTDYASTADIQDASLTYIAATGTDTVTATLSPAISAYATGAPIWLKAAATNTGAMTINLNSIGAAALKKQNDVAMAAGDIESGQIYCITYDGTDFQMQSQIANSTADATLNSLADLGTAADKYAYTTGVDTWAEGSITSAGRALLDDAAASNQRTTMGVAIGSDVQAFSEVLKDLSTDLTLAQGDIIYPSSSSALANLTPGTSGKQLQTGGAAANPSWEWPGHHLIETITASTDATIDFETSIDSTFDEYQIHIVDLVPATDDEELHLRYQIGAAWKSGSTDYSYNGDISANALSSNGAAQILLGVPSAGNGVGNASGESLSGVITITNPASTAAFKKAVAVFTYTRSAGDFPMMGTMAGQYDTDTGAVTGFRLLMSSGNITSGVFRLYGIRK